jgi:hypothetical protein
MGIKKVRNYPTPSGMEEYFIGSQGPPWCVALEKNMNKNKKENEGNLCSHSLCSALT